MVGQSTLLSAMRLTSNKNISIFYQVRQTKLVKVYQDRTVHTNCQNYIFVKSSTLLSNLELLVLLSHRHVSYEAVLKFLRCAILILLLFEIQVETSPRVSGVPPYLRVVIQSNVIIFPDLT